jgi:hypothetical protein
LNGVEYKIDGQTQLDYSQTEKPFAAVRLFWFERFCKSVDSVVDDGLLFHNPIREGLSTIHSERRFSPILIFAKGPSGSMRITRPLRFAMPATVSRKTAALAKLTGSIGEILAKLVLGTAH